MKLSKDEVLMDKSILLNLARNAISDVLYGTHSVDNKLKEKYGELQELRATFVTLNLSGNLRGCIGSLVARRSLFDDIVENAKAAAFSDPRFLPLSVEEFKNIEIEISLLTPPKALQYSDRGDLKNKLRVGIDGIILKSDGYQATFLPSVWEQLPTFELFFAHLCAKAGLEQDCLQRHPDIYVYQAKKIQ
ncbi:MAG: AmmeMemoRadiSam system protein A [Campylobacterales bacterium]|nr:AmmeMemoRadiSam system protein A [Campylobacterales bacterium]